MASSFSGAMTAADAGSSLLTAAFSMGAWYDDPDSCYTSRVKGVFACHHMACDRPRLLQKPAMKRALRIAKEVVKGS